MRRVFSIFGRVKLQLGYFLEFNTKSINVSIVFTLKVYKEVHAHIFINI